MEESNIDVLTANRMYKSRIFAMLFSDRNELLKLYNAINGTSYDDPDPSPGEYAGERCVHVHAE